MAGSIDEKLSAALQGSRPTVAGRLVSEAGDSIVLKAADAIIEIPTKNIVERRGRGEDLEVVLAPDAHLIVSAVVSVEKGFVGSNIFGPLVPSVLADNCNCNCNCGSIAGSASVREASVLRRPFTGGALPSAAERG